MNNKYKLSDEDLKKVVQFFELLLKADIRLHPEKYKSSKENTERTDITSTHQVAEKDQVNT